MAELTAREKAEREVEAAVAWSQPEELSPWDKLKNVAIEPTMKLHKRDELLEKAKPYLQRMTWMVSVGTDQENLRTLIAEIEGAE